MVDNRRELEELTMHLGEIIIKNTEDNDIICNVDNKKLKEYLEDNRYCFLTPNSRGKNITYIIDGFSFDNPSFAYTNSNIIIKNSRNIKELHIEKANIVQFENNEYSLKTNDLIYGRGFISTKNVKELIFKNDKVYNHKNNGINPRLDLNAETIRITKSSIGKPFEGTITMDADNIIINSSNIQGNSLLICGNYVRINPTTFIEANMSGLLMDKGLIECPINTNILLFNGCKIKPKERTLTYKKNNF